MPRKELIVSGYRSMYLVVFFDLPVIRKVDRKEYRKFRKTLLKDGFQMVQYSVYSRYCPSQFVVDQHMKTIHNALPPRGGVRIVPMTTKMYERMEVFHGRERQASEKEPCGYMFF